MSFQPKQNQTFATNVFGISFVTCLPNIYVWIRQFQIHNNGRSPSMKTIKDVINLSPWDYFPLGILTFKFSIFWQEGSYLHALNLILMQDILGRTYCFHHLELKLSSIVPTFHVIVTIIQWLFTKKKMKNIKLSVVVFYIKQ
jgi:hypothetical protein